jgi:pimeloyl-ACP methyl ester carboxylesterase
MTESAEECLVPRSLRLGTSRLSRRRLVRTAGVVATAGGLAAAFPFRSSATAAAVSFRRTEMAARPSVVLVHGAWADGSSWSGVIRLLQMDGYHVAAAQIPLTSLADDVAVTRTFLAAQTGPTVLVGHSYGGVAITAAAADAENVIGLVYVSAFAPDQGESLQDLSGQGDPSPGLAAIQPDAQGFLWIDPAKFPAVFAADVEASQAAVMAAVQKPIAASIFGDKPAAAAWHTLPSWFLISEDDQMIPPAGQHAMAERMEATVRTVPSSHASLVSHPDEVVALIGQAARTPVD